MRPNIVHRLELLTCISFVTFLMWVVLCLKLRLPFQNTANIDPLAMINTLFPYFWVLLLAFGVVCIAALFLYPSSRWLHIVLLSQLSLILFYTPFFLSGFSWSPDSLWHGGVAGYMPDVLSGAKLPFSDYAQSYPLSFVTTYIAESVSGLNVFSFTLYVYPVVLIVSITVIAYTFVSRLLTPRTAFLSLLFTLPASHFIEPHVSPFSAGTLLVLISLVFTTVRGAIARFLLLFTILALVLTHPISPITLGIFLFVVVVSDAVINTFSLRRGFSTSLPTVSVSNSILLFLGLSWAAWTFYWAISIYVGVETAILNVISFKFFSRFEYATEWTMGGGFIYQEINTLSLIVYAIFLLSASALLLLNVGKSALGNLFHRKATTKGQKTRPIIDYEIVILALSSIGYAAFSYVLFLATRQRYMLGRGLIFFILFASICISKYIIRQNNVHKRIRNLGNLIIVILFVFLLVSFPIVSYSKEAYNTFTPSSDHGLAFIASYIDVANKSISLAFLQQLAAYVNLSEPVLISRFPPRELNLTDPDFIVLQRGFFFSSAMRHTFSFKNNTYTWLQDRLNRDPVYDNIYSSSTFEIYSLTEG